MGANFLDYVLGHLGARQSVDHITRAGGLPSAGCELAHSGQRAPEKLAVNRVEDDCQHDRTPLFDRGSDRRDSFQADFAAQGNGFVGTRRFKAPPAKQRWRALRWPSL